MNCLTVRVHGGYPVNILKKTMILQSPIGSLEILSDGVMITRIAFAGKKTMKQPKEEEKHLKILMKELAEYFAGKCTTFSVSLQPEGTPFQTSVWRAIGTIPYGKTATYADIAKKIGKPKDVRAVGTVCGKNPMILVIPCHRVIASSGGLGGYLGGIEKKKLLLRLEHRKNLA